MVRISYTVYNDSVLATIISFISKMITIASIFFVIAGFTGGGGGMIVGGIVGILLIGVGGSVLAESINTYQSNTKWWKKSIVQQGLDAQIRQSTDFCFKVYNANPCEWTLNQIQALNASGAAQIRQALAAKNSK